MHNLLYIKSLSARDKNISKPFSRQPLGAWS